MMKIRKGSGALALLAGLGLLAAFLPCFGGCCPFNALSQKLGLSQAMAGEAVEKEVLNVTLKVGKGGEKR